jgi:hypothetical protein
MRGTTTAFKYSPLNCPQSIRLLLLKPSRLRDTPLQCHLMRFKLSALPRYEALSYTWEGQRPCRPISCNGSELLVTPNVEAALKQLRPRHFQRHLWIDAICIDQSNLKERSSQVSLMEQIYQNAVRVVVWLGVGNEMTARAFRTLKWVFPLYKLNPPRALRKVRFATTFPKNESQLSRCSSSCRRQYKMDQRWNPANLA